MELPDFARNEDFRSLLRKMTITRVLQLTPPSWKDWEGFGIDVGDISEIVVNPDRTLSYDGRRVLVYIRDQFMRDEVDLPEYRFHVAECQTLTNMREQKRFGRYVVTTRQDGQFVVNLFRQGEPAPTAQGLVRTMAVCINCLKELNWSGYNSRKRSTQKQIRDSFTPRSFLEEYGSMVRVLPTQTSDTAPLNVYPENWSEISRRHRERRRWTCEQCGLVLSQPNLRKWLEVHHIDGNRANCRERNLKALCLGCHQQQPAHERLRKSPRFQEFQRWRKRPRRE